MVGWNPFNPREEYYLTFPSLLLNPSESQFILMPLTATSVPCCYYVIMCALTFPSLLLNLSWCHWQRRPFFVVIMLSCVLWHFHRCYSVYLDAIDSRARSLLSHFSLLASVSLASSSAWFWSLPSSGRCMYGMPVYHAIGMILITIGDHPTS